MRKENGVLVLENEEDKDLLFDYFDDYLSYFNYDNEDYHKTKELICNLDDARYKLKGLIDYFIFEKLFKVFADREEFNVTLFPKALKCLEALELVKVEYKKEPKYKLTKNTHTLLSMLELNWIAKNKNGKVYGYESEKYFDCLDCFKNVDFSFLHWEDEEPLQIKDILNNCIVIKEE